MEVVDKSNLNAEILDIPCRINTIWISSARGMLWWNARPLLLWGRSNVNNCGIIWDWPTPLLVCCITLRPWKTNVKSTIMMWKLKQSQPFRNQILVVFSVFLFQGCCLGEADGVAEGFYLWAGSQGKVCRHNIRDRVPTWKKGFSGFCYIPIILFKYFSHYYPPPKLPINTPYSEK